MGGRIGHIETDGETCGVSIKIGDFIRRFICLATSSGIFSGFGGTLGDMRTH